MKRLFLFVLALSVSAVGVSAAEGSLEERVDGLQARIDRAVSKAGIHFGGEFRAQFLSSTVEGDALGIGKTHESVEFTSVDFDIAARPNTALTARAMFRLHQDWRIFFSDVQNPITTRWLSIDGSVMDGIIKYNIGDYHKRLTPLTLWSPDIDILFEPEIFAENRRAAMADAFVGDNNRALQGVNMVFDAELYPLLHSVRLDLFGARLAIRGTGESGITAPGVGGIPNGQYWDKPYDKYLLGVNFETQIFKGLGVGLGNILIYDHIASYKGGAAPTAADTTAARMNAQSTNVFAGRLNADTRLFMEDDFINIGLKGEAAFSSDKKPYMEAGNPDVLDSAITGMAINAGLTARVTLSEGNTINLSAEVIMNDSTFRNDAAQSPSFVQRNIMNNENGMSGLGLMNPFDALYRNVFKFAPSQYFGGPKPYTKNAYINAILTPAEVGSLVGDKTAFYYPSIFQAALPGGMATADRFGPVVNLRGSFLDNGIKVGAKIAMLESVGEYSTGKILSDITDGEGNITGHNYETLKQNFEEIVGGVSIDIAKFAPVVGPSLVIGGSYGMFNGKHGDIESKNNLISAELAYNFHPRFTLLGGIQMLTSDLPESRFDDVVSGVVTGDYTVGKYDYTFSNMSIGLSYKVADGGFITAKLSMLSGEKEMVGGSRWEEELGVPTMVNDNYSDKKKYTAFQPEVFMTVKF